MILTKRKHNIYSDCLKITVLIFYKQQFSVVKHLLSEGTLGSDRPLREKA